MVNSSGTEKDRLKAWQMFYCGCCLVSADCGGGRGWAADVLAVRWWWLEERRLVLVCPQVKKVAVCQSVGSSSQTENFRRSLKFLTSWLSSLIAGATNGGLKCFVGVQVNVSGLEGPACCWPSTTLKEIGCPQDYCCFLLLATWL